MTGWTPPKKPRYKTPEQRGVERAQERAKVKTYMSKADEHDAANLQCADYFLRQRADLGEECFEIQWAVRVFARLRPDVEL